MAAATARPGEAAGRPRRVRPYPLSELPRLLRVQVELARALWLHLWGVLASARVSSPAGQAALQARLGGALRIVAQEPYLVPADRAATLLRGGLLLQCELLTPAHPGGVLVLDEGLCARLGQGHGHGPGLGPAQGPGQGMNGEALALLVRDALAGAPLRVHLGSASEATTLLGEHPSRMTLAMDLRLAVGDQTGWGRLLTRADLRLLAAPPPPLSAQVQRYAHRHRLDQARVELCIEAGYGFLPTGAVVALVAGDVVVLDHFGPKPITGGPVSLRIGHGAFTAHLDGAGVTVLSSFHLRAAAMATPDEKNEAHSPEPSLLPGDSAGGPAPPSEQLLRELPVQITCEIGRITLSAREVLELRPGSVLPVGRPLAGPVDLTAGGRVIARGELVDVEGEIGVRVTEVLD
jgi:type III secretion system YscQ/HrcQ family protein